MFLRLTIIFFCLFGLCLKTGIFEGRIKLYTMIYFTIQSNLLVLITYTVSLALNIYRNNKIFNMIYGLMLTNIILTCIVYFGVLIPSGFSMYGELPYFDLTGNLILHLVIPVLVLADFLIGNNKNSILSFRLIPIGDFCLILYFLFLIIQAKLGGFIPNQSTKYPYSFIAVDMLGWKKAVENGLLVLLFHSFISFSAVCVSKKINTKKS